MIELKRLYLILMGLAAATACVNEEYDLSKDIDSEMTILKDIALPLGDVGKISIADILEFDTDEESMFQIDQNGDLMMSFSGEKVAAEINVPSFKISRTNKIETQPILVYFWTGPAAGKDASFIPGNIVYSEIRGKQLESAMYIEINSLIPSEIKDIRSLTLDASLEIDFKVNMGVYHLMKGFTLDFPKILNINKKDENDNRFDLIDGHKLVLKEDLEVSAASPLALSLAIDKITVPEGSIEVPYLKLNEKVAVSGDFYLSPSDYMYIPDELDIEIKAEINDLDIKSADVKVDLSTVLSGTKIYFGDFPDAFEQGKVCLDIYNPTFSLDINNPSPFTFGASASLIASSASQKAVIVLGQDPKINLPANTLSKYVISRRAVDVQGVTNIVVPELADVMKMSPDLIEVSYINMRTIDNDFITINSGDKYSASLSYAFNAPLAFGEDLNLDFSTDLEFDVSVLEGAELRMNVVNSVPFDFAITAEVLDANKEPINGIDLNVDCSVKGGTHLSPVETPVTLYIRNNGTTEKFCYIRLNMSVKSPSGEMVGVALNKNQGLELKDVTLSLKEGFTINK